MKKILIINIDRNFRSVYVAGLAAAMLKSNKLLKITLIISDQNQALESLGLFENIHYLDTDKFFETTRKSSNDTTEREIRNFLAPVLHTSWDTVVNLSSNLLGAYFTYFLKSQEVVGPHFQGDLVNLKHSNFPSYLLTSMPDEYSNYFHFSYIYKNVIKVYDQAPLGIDWKNKGSAAFVSKINLLKIENGKIGLVLIDTSIKKMGDLVHINFLIDLFGRLREDERFLPVLLSSNTEEDSFLINRLRDQFQGEIHLISCRDEAKFCLLDQVSLVITDDLYLKSLADLSLKPSVFIFNGSQLPLSDFSNVEGSFMIQFNEMSDDLIEAVFKSCETVLNHLPENIGKFKDIEIYQTAIYDQLPILEPLLGGGQTYAKWLLSLRYLAMIQKKDLPPIHSDHQIYRVAIDNERKEIKEGFNTQLAAIKIENIHEISQAFDFNALEQHHGILSVGIKTLRYSNDYKNDPKKFLEKLKQLLQDMTEFLNKEESSLGDVQVIS